MNHNQQSQLVEEIIKVIQAKPTNRITFYEFMKMALYAPELGYYTKDKTKIGKNADFYTSSSVGSIYGKIIANNFVELLPYTTDEQVFSILEIGGGNGRFARDVLDELKEKNDSIYENLKYYMLETSPYHKLLQNEHVKEHLDHVVWINDLQELPSPFEGIIFSNELVDAFPVHKVKQVDGKLKEVFVMWEDEENNFLEIIDELSDSRLNKYFQDQGIAFNEGQTAEINLDAIEWISSVSNVLKRGYILTIDYGYPAEELYESYRHDGTLMCYHRHIANDNPYQNIGDQDITTHVNFSVLMSYGERLGLENIWFTTQSRFLLNNGILNHLQEIGFENIGDKNIINDEALKLNRAIRQLITPGEMGETFKVLLQQKNIGHKQYKFLTKIWQQYGM